MAEQRITRVLMDEHRVIERMLDVVAEAATRLERGEAVAPNLFAEAGAFFAEFADRCHHHKEEGELFPAMERRGVPGEGGPIGVMLHEHDQGRGYVRIIRAEGQKYAEGTLADPQLLVDAVHDYVDLLRQHILKEDRILYPMADQVLTGEDQKALWEAAERIEREEMGAGEHERWHAVVEELEAVGPSD